MSMPSSRLEVATTQRSRPDLRSSSIRSRWSLLTEPWCARASSGAAPELWLLPPMTWAGDREPSVGSAGVVRAANASLSRAVRRSATPRELTNTMVDDRCSTWSRIASSTWGQMLPPRCSEGGSSCSSPGVTGRAAGSCVRSSTGIDDGELESARRVGCDDAHRPGAAEEPSDLLVRAHRGAQPDAASRSGQQGVEALQGQRQMAAALGAGHGMHLVDDDGVDVPQRVTGSRGQHQEQRLRRRDQDVRGPLHQSAAVALARVAGPDPDRDVVEGVAAPRGRLGDADERGSQIALDIDGQCLER